MKELDKIVKIGYISLLVEFLSFQQPSEWKYFALVIPWDICKLRKMCKTILFCGAKNSVFYIKSKISKYLKPRENGFNNSFKIHSILSNAVYEC